MALPHLKKENNFEMGDFESVENEMARYHDNRHPFVPAHDVKNPALDNDEEPKDDKKASDGS